MTIRQLALCASAILLLLGCAKEPERREPYATLMDLIENNRSLRTIHQGIFGTVTWWSGDFMPTIDGDGPSGTIDPYSDSVFVFEAFKSGDTALYDGFGGSVWNVTAPLLGSTLSTSTGSIRFPSPRVNTQSFSVSQGILCTEDREQETARS